MTYRARRIRIIIVMLLKQRKEGLVVTAKLGLGARLDVK